MDEEIKSIEKNQTWDLVDIPKENDVISVKWVYKTKHDAEGKTHKHKARLVVRGFTQQHGVEYDEAFAPVARMDTIRVVLAIVS